LRHLGFMARNAWRSFALALTGARLARVPVEGASSIYCRRLTRYSCAFALITDAALATLGGGLKRREKISGRLADALAWMYLASAAIKRFHDEGSPTTDLPLLRWSCDLALYNVERSLRGVIDNLPNRLVAWKLRALVFPLGTRHTLPSDALGAEIAKAVLDDGEMRKRLTGKIFIPGGGEPGLGQLEAALALTLSTRPAAEKLASARRAGHLAQEPDANPIDQALALGILDAGEAQLLRQASAAQDAAIAVDAFSPEQCRQL
ncbi:MAG: DUF1974 domain-containing protein, partial [Alphaproteobacteria bacterium]